MIKRKDMQVISFFFGIRTIIFVSVTLLHNLTEEDIGFIQE